MVVDGETILDVHGVCAGYGAADTIRSVSLTVHPAEVLGLAGRNGVGKSTLAKTIVGQLRTKSGAIRLDGVPIHAERPSMRAARGIGYVPQGRAIFTMSVRDNLCVGRHVGQKTAGSTYGLGIERVYQMFPVLERYARRDARTLSGGEQQMLAIGRALVGKPRLLILDEPSEGIQPSIIVEIGHAVVRLARELRIGVLLIEQNVGLLTASSDRVCILEKGSVVAEIANVDDTKSDEIARYLAL